MPDAFFSLSRRDRSDALGVVAGQSGRPVHLLEKDVWVVWALETLYGAPFGSHLVFKGGTSLSKAYNAIERFSEDVDLTYDIVQRGPSLIRISCAYCRRRRTNVLTVAAGKTVAGTEPRRKNCVIGADTRKIQTTSESKMKAGAC